MHAELDKSKNDVKVIMLEVGQACKGAAIEDIAKAALSRRGVSKEIDGLRVTCPAGKSKEKDGKHFVDVVIKCIEFETKKSVEQALRDNRIRCGVQWPRDLVPGVKTLHDGYAAATITVKEKDQEGNTTEQTVCLADYHILIRPCYANNMLKILVRKPPAQGGQAPPFQLLEMMNYPMSDEYMKKYGGHNNRIKSKYKVRFF